LKATKAYIASLGTTGVLLAASVLMLAVVSAVVAFDAWPGANAPNPVRTLVLNDKPAAIRVSAHATAPATAAARRAVLAAGAARGRAVTRPAGGLPGQRLSGGNRSVTPARPAPALPAPVAKPVQQVQNAASPIFDAVSNPGSTATQVADTAQGVTDSAGVSLAKISPQVGAVVQQAGQTAAQTVRQLPLPDHLVPGH
jgi:hypothetical protein